MSDDLDDLKTLMQSATPRPDPARRAENLALARKNFETFQGSQQAARPTPVTGPNGLWTGVMTMLNTLKSKGALSATTALVACGLLFLTPGVQDMLRPSTPPQITMTELEGTITEPQIEDSPLLAEELSDDLILQEPATAPFGDIQRGPLSIPPSSDEAMRVPQTPPAPAAPQKSEPAEAELAEIRPMVTPQARSTTDSADINGAILGGAAEPSAMLEAMPTPSDRLSMTASPPAPTVLLRPTARDTESFANADSNQLQITSEMPVSTFSIDVDTASYGVVRSSLNRAQLPPANAVRIEELINYFPYDYPAPGAGEAPFRPTVSAFQTPWNEDTQLVHIALQGQMPALDDRPPLNLVFLIDTSGSMDDPSKLPLLKQSFRLMLGALRPSDQVAIVEYAGSAGQVLAPTAASERSTILNAIQSLGAGGSTNGQGGLEQAYAVAETMQADGEISRVILATDGDFNVGLSNPAALEDFIADKRETGTYLSVLGFGRGNLDDRTMQALAQNGNGIAAYIDTLSEAQKVLVDQLSGALFPIAGDVKVQVEFNPAQIAEYRLIGYETRALAREDFNNDAVDAGELGAGHTVTAIYEVTPVGSPAQRSDPLRYGESNVAAISDELGYVKLRFKAPGDDVSQLIETPIIGSNVPGTEAHFAAAIAGFGQLLRNPQYLGDWGYEDAIALANANRGDDPFGYRTEAVQLMRLAQSLAQ
ncbi:VWA domain-containing protein [Yoonia sp. BS5-3]|uniref:VWA domain-containing protein n=1 Tax=Yoonia phaeophyticola TaxID=3137369 RepID=A0ABZ2V3P2_9RHOB